MPNVSVVIPTLNEKKNIIKLIPRLHKQSLNSIYIIDDGSRDGSDEIAKSYPGVHFIVRSRKLGLISAEIDGMRATNSDYVVIMDADLSHRPEDIAGMIEKAVKTNADLVIGSRYIDNGETHDEFIRQIISKTANRLFRLSFNLNVHDCTSGFRVYSRRACNFLARQVDIENGYVGQIDILNRLHKNGFKIEEYPVNFVKREEGKSKLKMKEIVNFFLFVFFNGNLVKYFAVSILITIAILVSFIVALKFV